MKSYALSGTSAATPEPKAPAQDTARHTPRAAANHLSPIEQVRHDAANVDRDAAELARVQQTRPLKPPGRR